MKNITTTTNATNNTNTTTATNSTNTNTTTTTANNNKFSECFSVENFSARVRVAGCEKQSVHGLFTLISYLASYPVNCEPNMSFYSWSAVWKPLDLPLMLVRIL